jgi:aminomethyltransferase
MAKVTPFEQVHKKMGANFGEYWGWKMPSDYGDEKFEYGAGREGCAAFDLSCFGRFMVKGDGAEDMLQDKLGGGSLPGEKECVFLNGSRVANCEGDFMVLTRPEGRSVFEEMAAEGDFEGFEIEDIGSKTGMLGLYGPLAVEVLDRIIPLKTGDMSSSEVRCLNLFMIKITIIRGSWTGGDGIELICPSGAAGLAGGAISKYRDREGIVAGGMEALMKLMGGGVQADT